MDQVKLRTYKYTTECFEGLPEQPQKGEWVVQQWKGTRWVNIEGPFDDEQEAREMEGKIRTLKRDEMRRELFGGELTVKQIDALLAGVFGSEERDGFERTWTEKPTFSYSEFGVKRLCRYFYNAGAANMAKVMNEEAINAPA